MRALNADLAVLMAGLTAVANPPRYECSLAIDQNESKHYHLTTLAVLKSPHLGGGMNYGIPTKMDDGLFRVVGIEAMTRREMMFAVRRMYDGSIARHRKVWSTSCRSLSIEASDAPVIEADGELIGFAPASYVILPTKLKILV